MLIIINISQYTFEGTSAASQTFLSNNDCIWSRFFIFIDLYKLIEYIKNIQELLIMHQIPIYKYTHR